MKGNRQEDTGMSSADLLETEIQSSADSWEQGREVDRLWCKSKEETLYNRVL